ncbi:hypothetical protein ACYB2S_13695 [Corynebacterium variabile]|uniref:hypothetical protein n=1 Tax=Corynebacterium variabile TaxID=1727 RepID=UPI003C9E7CCA
MLVYANRDALEAWTGEPAPDNWDQLIRRASVMVGVATRAARYEVTPAGLPADDDQAEAMRDAVCAQVNAWIIAGVDPLGESLSAKVTTSTIDGATVALDVATEAADRQRIAGVLCSDAWDILTLAGLIGGHPWVMP